MLLVFAVMFLFLQNIRYTLIPTLVVPVALMGTFATMLALGFSINVLTMFGMVLAIGILVDDAIVVVENVERIMARKACRPRRPRARRWADHRRDHRHHPGAGGGVHSDGVHAGLGGVIYRSSRCRWRCRSCSRRSWP
jgi:Cu/Ag efflux pump CusA